MGVLDLNNTMGSSNTGGTCYFIGCRAWNCSDQGFAPALDAASVVDRCWSFCNGNLQVILEMNRI